MWLAIRARVLEAGAALVRREALYHRRAGLLRLEVTGFNRRREVIARDESEEEEEEEEEGRMRRCFLEDSMRLGYDRMLQG